MIRSVLRTSSARSQGGAHADETESSERSTRTSSFSVMHSSGVHPDFEDSDRPRAVSSTHALLSMVTPGYWGSRERRDDSTTMNTGALEESARLQGAAGPEDGESEAATDRRRSRSRSEDGGPVAQIMARSRGTSVTHFFFTCSVCHNRGGLDPKFPGKVDVGRVKQRLNIYFL